MNLSRINDIVVGTCPCHKSPISVTGFISSGSSDVLANNSGVSRIGDIVVFSCGHVGTIISGSPNVTSNGIPVSRISDTTSCPIGTIVTGSPNVLTS